MEENNKIIENIKATMAMEKLFLNNDDVELLQDYLNNNILEADAVEKIKSQFLN